MNKDQENTDTIHIEQISFEQQHPQVNNQQDENFIKPKEFIRQINRDKKIPMTPTRLEFSWWSTHPTETAVILFALFTVIIITSGIMIVCLTQSIPTGHKCAFVIKSLIRNSITNDSRPHSVAIGDFNNDGLLDIVVANSGINNIGVFLWQAKGNVTDQMIYSTGSDSTPFAVVVTDFNRDQQLDIAVANFGSHTIGIFIGIDNGTFELKTMFSTGSSRPRSIAAADFNNDTRIDIVVVNYATNNIGIFLQDINDSFINQTTFSTGYDSDPYLLAVGDLNNDNKLDIVVANYGTDNVGVFLGYGNGSFATQTIFSTGLQSHPSSIAISNLNGDTYLDIAVACSGTNSIGVLIGYGNGTFTIPTLYATGNNSLPYSIAIADLDSDDKFDIAVANYGYGSITVLLGDGNGNFSFQNQTFFNSSNFRPYAVAIGDFNMDTQSDIVVVDYDLNYVEIILNNRNYNFYDRTTYTTNIDSYPASVVIADLNNDNMQDIIVANTLNDDIMILYNYDHGDSWNGTFSFLSGGDFGPRSIAVGDFNNDNWLDIVVANFVANNVGIFLGDRSGIFSDPIQFSTTGSNSYPLGITISDFNNDNQLDVVVANSGSDNIGVFLGFGDGTFYNQVIYSTGSYSAPYSIAIGDFNSDTQLDIVVANSGTNNVGIFLGYGDGTFSNQLIYSTGIHSIPSSVAVGDFNNDNQLDIIVTNFRSSIILFFGYGNGIFSNQITIPVSSSTGLYAISINDFNNDNQLDVVVVNYLANKIGILMGYGNGSFSRQTTYPTGSNSQPCSVAVGDLNEDGYSDIVVANPNTNNIGIFVGYGNGSFFTEQTKSTTYPSRPNSVAVGDFNGDGRLDITVANSKTNNVGIFLGDGNGTFSNYTTYSTGAWSLPCSIVVADFNSDSQLDIVVANFWAGNIGIFLGYGDGTFSDETTFSTGNDSHPYAVAVGDFNNDNQLDIAVANRRTANVIIFLGYSNGIFVSQAIYPTGSIIDFGPNTIAVGDFNNDNQLDFAVASVATDTIGVFFGYGNGTFSSQSSFFITKNARPMYVAVDDLNNDDQLDVVVTTRGNYGITVFLGNGDGTFIHKLFRSVGSLSQPYACTLGDVNNDNQLDVVVSDNRHRDIVILFGDGDGSFSKTETYSTGDDSVDDFDNTTIALGDFDNDKILDIVVTNENTNTIRVFRGSTYINGVHESICLTGSSPHPRAVALSDFNKDTQLDIVITNYELGNVEILLQDGNKTFPMQIISSTGALSLPTSVAIGDFNNDSKLDITVVNSGTQNIGIFYGYGNGSFATQMMFSTESNFIPQSVAVGDFNNDERLDIVVADSGTESVMTLLRYDPGAFGNKTIYSTGTDSNPVSLAIGDINNDGWLDFVVANSDSDHVGVFLGLGNGIFSNQTIYSTGSNSNPRCVAIADLNRDSYLDAIACNSLNNAIGIFLGFGDGTFSSQTTYPIGPDSYPTAIAIGDFNNDDRLDIVTTDYWNGNIVIFFDYDNGFFSNIIYYLIDVNSYPLAAAVGDFNDDDQLDIVIVNVGTSNLGVFLGYGDGTFSSMIPYSTGNHAAPLSVVVGDFNNDDQLDLAVSNAGTDNIGILFGNGNGNFSAPTFYTTGPGSTPYSLATGDFNNDNQLDIASVNSGSNCFSVLLGCDNGTFFSPLSYSIANNSEPSFVGVGDFNNDHRLDIVTTDTFTNNVVVFFGYTSESYLFAPSYSTGSLSQPTSIAVGDFNNDTRLDVVVVNNGMNNIMVLFGSGYGTFISHTSYSTGNESYPCGVAVGDFNNDSRLDIVVVNSGTNNVGIFLSNDSGIFSSQITYSTGLGSQPYSVAILDFDNDTRLDIAVTNYGSNNIIVLFGDGNGRFIMTDQSTYNTGFDSHPYAIAVADLNNDNQSDIIATNDGYGNIDIILKEC